MPVLKFDYLLRPHLQNGKIVPIYRPIVPLSISTSNNTYPNMIRCVVDSGGDFNLMPAHIGEYMGLNIQSGVQVTHMGIANIGITAYEHEVTMLMQDYSFKTTVHFSYDHTIPLVGRYGFFAYFKKVTFNESKLCLELMY